MSANSRLAMATHIMTALALDHQKQHNSSELAQSLNTNPVVVRRIMLLLQKHELLSCTSGRSGGVTLARKASQISLYHIYEALEEDQLFAYNPNDPNKKCPLSCTMKSILQPVFDSAQEALAQSLKRIKLSDLVERVNQKHT